jgi:hypothetical protein
LRLAALCSFAAKILSEMRDFFIQWYGFHGLRILQPRRPRNGIETEANEVNEEEFLLRLLRSLLFKRNLEQEATERTENGTRESLFPLFSPVQKSGLIKLFLT